MHDSSSGAGKQAQSQPHVITCWQHKPQQTNLLLECNLMISIMTAQLAMHRRGRGSYILIELVLLCKRVPQTRMTLRR